ncbi:glycosyl transferase [Mediterraneibacter glycyrrhizinilyticus]|uniref:glycosyltransferase family 32 protein n=1 Tax=Mediterraneibacter glycyrrhizinilyticus TaxID=342942 RepID=UPI0026597918|nr:glycosyltransferase [Mediterraneibacter glycyrrhizinilyticus]MCF2570489.1 glycosyl transferase [Mediterraneibacter glycyrrhizinilyticus]
MIPKIIHYCWFGRKPKSALVEKCIASWKKYCPDWDIKEWNEDNFDITVNAFCLEAYNQKKWAFVSDYVRFDVLNRYGGVYVDTDVEILKPIDRFLIYSLFAGHETDQWIAPGLILGSEPGHPILQMVLTDYEKESFFNENGKEKHKTVGEYFTEALIKYGIRPSGYYQEVNGIALFPKDYFCPMDDSTGIVTKTENTYTIHWYNKTWISPGLRFRVKITRLFHRIFGVNCFAWLKGIGK